MASPSLHTGSERGEVAYRPAVPDDAEACIVLRGQTRQNAISVQRLQAMGITARSWAEAVRCGRLTGVVCHVDGRLAGHCYGQVADGEIVVLALRPEHEGRGLGRELLGRVVAQLAALGRTRLVLGCSPDPRHRSHGFYRHLGWRPTGQTDPNGDELLEFHLQPTA